MSAAATSATPVLRIELSTTADMPDGQPVPPYSDNVLWRTTRRIDGRTLWRCISLSHPPITEWRRPGDQSARRKKERHHHGYDQI